MKHLVSKLVIGVVIVGWIFVLLFIVGFLEHPICHTTFKSTSKGISFVSSLGEEDVDGMIRRINFDSNDDPEKYEEDLAEFFDEHEVSVEIMESEIGKDDCFVTGVVNLLIIIDEVEYEAIFRYSQNHSDIRPKQLTIVGEDDDYPLFIELSRLITNVYHG